VVPLLDGERPEQACASGASHLDVAKPAVNRHDAAMDDAAFDRALIAAAFQTAAEQGWRSVSVAAAARAAGLPLARARERFPGRIAILIRFGRLADQAALAEAPPDGPARDRLFDLLMRRIDALQAHRAGVLALLRALPGEPPTALLLTLANRRSMRWMLEAAGIPSRGIYGELRVKGLLAVWLWTIRTWRTDDSEDLSATMAALDAALRRAGQAAQWLGWRAREAETPPEAGEPEAPAPEAPPPETPSPETPA
jgi:AcrR family transcriptional regulator